MTFAKGRTNCEAERDTIVQGFHELLYELKHAKNQIEVQAKASLYDVVNDQSLSNDERRSQMRPFEELLSEQEEKDIRIRRTILIGLFSFWELSLKDLCEYYKINVTKTKNNKNKKEEISKHVYKFSENDYLNAIFRDHRPKNIALISSQIKELRNYMAHGNAGEDRQVIIDNFIVTNPDFCVSEISGDYYITSYDGLDKMLKIITEGLIDAETTAKNLKTQTN